MANTQITWNNGTTGNRKIWTWSFWVKRAKVDSEQVVWTTRYNASNNHLFRFNSNGTFSFKGANSASGTIMDLDSNEKFLDNSAWYHFVLAVDSTQSTASNRAKVYVNGNQITSFATADYGAQDQSYEINEANNQVFWIGSENSQNYFDGYLSHVWFIDGTQYPASTFGETDSTTGEWKIKTDITPTMGTNGFQILKDGAGLTDTSSNSNNFSASSGNLLGVKDCPSDNYAVLNVHDRDIGGSNTFSNGSNTLVTNGNGTRSTLAAKTGKYYAEVKMGANGVMCGIQETRYAIFENTGTVLLLASGATLYVAGSSSSYGSAWSASDIMQIAMDLDSGTKKVYFGKNGSWWNGSAFAAANPDTGTTLTGDFYAFRSDSGVGTPTADWNFGNGFFGTTAISSAGTNASGIGSFEYDVPSGYSALSTKGMNR